MRPRIPIEILKLDGWGFLTGYVKAEKVAELEAYTDRLEYLANYADHYSKCDRNPCSCGFVSRLKAVEPYRA